MYLSEAIKLHDVFGLKTLTSLKHTLFSSIRLLPIAIKTTFIMPETELILHFQSKFACTVRSDFRFPNKFTISKGSLY